jgi:two-component system NarL family sensor kinase
LLDEMGLASAVRWFASSFTERTGIRVEMDLGDVARMAVATERALFRVVQDSLINSQRHARSSTASVSLGTVDGAIELAIRDKGHGLRDKHGTVISAKMGAGILGMRERVYQLGGTFEIQFTNRGTTVRVRVPLKESDR